MKLVKQKVKEATELAIEALEELADDQEKELAVTRKKISELKRQLEK